MAHKGTGIQKIQGTQAIGTPDRIEKEFLSGAAKTYSSADSVNAYGNYPQALYLPFDASAVDNLNLTPIYESQGDISHYNYLAFSIVVSPFTGFSISVSYDGNFFESRNWGLIDSQTGLAITSSAAATTIVGVFRIEGLKVKKVRILQLGSGGGGGRVRGCHGNI